MELALSKHLVSCGKSAQRQSHELNGKNKRFEGRERSLYLNSNGERGKQSADNWEHKEKDKKPIREKGISGKRIKSSECGYFGEISRLL